MSVDDLALRVFLCHAEEDKPNVRILYRNLVLKGIDAWLGEERLLPGQERELEIRKAIREADVVIVCHSKTFDKTGFQQKEVRLALEAALEKPEGEIFIIPARLEECDILQSLRKWNRVDLFGDGGYENLMRALGQRAKETNDAVSQALSSNHRESGKHTLEGSFAKDDENGIITSEGIISSSEAKMNVSMRSERLVSARVLKDWLKMHGLEENPFGDFDLKNHPHYPKGAARPNRWDAFFDPISSFALCLTHEDAQALSYLLRKECMPGIKNEEESGSRRWIFPLKFSPSFESQLQSPLHTLAYCAAQAWLDFLPKNSNMLLELSQSKQNAVLELLHWALGSAHTIINLLQDNGLEEDTNGLSLIIKIEKAAKELPASLVPQGATLLSWLKLRPLSCRFTYLILPLDELPVTTRSLWFEQLSILLPKLSVEPDGIVTKAISFSDFSGWLPLPVTPLTWSKTQLQLSLDSQFDISSDLSLDPKSPKERKAKFIELFGSGPFGYAETEERTTDRLISASRNSLARMLMLGNRLLQYHCDIRQENEVPEKYLYTDDLETILNSA